MPSSRREQTRRKLVRAAADVVARHGFHQASVDEIASRAGYSIGALYSNFDTKDDLLFAVFDEHVVWFEDRLAAVAAAEDTGLAMTEWMAYLGRQPQQFLVFIEFWAYAVRKKRERMRLAQRLAQMRSRVAEVTGDERLALVALATARGLAIEKLADGDAVPNDVVAEFSAALGSGQGRGDE
jgi:AcrR family transcriptional regulator